TASLATCATAAAHREARLRDFHRFAVAAIEEGRRGTIRAYAFELGRDPVRAAELAENLMNAGVEVQWAAKPFRSTGAKPVWEDAPAVRAAEGKGAGRARPGKGAAAQAGAPAAAAREVFAPRAFARGAFVTDLAQPAGPP